MSKIYPLPETGTNISKMAVLWGWGENVNLTESLNLCTDGQILANGIIIKRWPSNLLISIVNIKSLARFILNLKD